METAACRPSFRSHSILATRGIWVRGGTVLSSGGFHLTGASESQALRNSQPEGNTQTLTSGDSLSKGRHRGPSSSQETTLCPAYSEDRGLWRCWSSQGDPDRSEQNRSVCPGGLLGGDPQGGRLAHPSYIPTPWPCNVRAQTISLSAAQYPVAGSLCSLSPGELRRGGGQEQASQAFLPHSWGHALLPPCLSLAINYFRLAKSGLLLSCSQPPVRPGPGPWPGNPQHPQSPECSGQLGQRKLGDLFGHQP